MKTITLGNLLQIFPLPCNNRAFNRDKIRNLLPEDISNKLLLVEGKDCSPAQLTNVWQSNSQAQPRIFKNVFDYLDQSTTFNDYCKEILEKWQTVENLDARKFRSTLEKILSDDEDKNEMSDRLFRWFNAVFTLENLELLRYALTAMTVLAVTRGIWLKISKKLMPVLPHVSTLPGQPDKDNEKAFNACKEAYDAACKETRNNLAPLNTEQHLQTVEDNLKNVFNAKKPRWNAHVDAVFGDIWIRIAERTFSDKGAKRIAKHRIWLSENEIIGSNQDNISVAINFFKKAQNFLADEAFYDDWCKVSDDLLNHLMKLLDKGYPLPEDFKKTANAPKDHKDWYGKATFRLAKLYFDKSVVKKFIKWLKRSVTLKNVNAMNLAMKFSCFNDAAKDTAKKWTQAFDLTEEENKALKACPNGWNEDFALKLAEKLKDADNPKIRGAARYLLYLDRGNKQDLRIAWNCGYPKAAVLEYEKTIVYFVEELSHAESKGTHGTCVINVGSDHPLAKIFAATMPKSEDGWDISFDSIAIPPTEGHQIFLLIDDDKEKNLSQFLHLLNSLRNNDTPAISTKIFLRCSADRHTVIVDTALNRFPDCSHLSVRILDDVVDAVQNLFVNECPLFVPLVNSKNVTTLHLIVVGDNNPLTLQIVREASWFMTFDKTISTKITMLTPFGISLKNQLLMLCSEITSSTTIEEKPILMPGFPFPDGLKNPDTLQSVMDKLVKTRDEAIYFAVTAFQSSTENLNTAILVREAYLRAWIKYAVEGERPPKVPVAYFCPNDDFALLSKYAIVYAQDYGADWFNNFSLTPFGSQLRYSWSQLFGDGELAAIERIAVQVHMVYCNLSAENFSEDKCRTCYSDYAKWTYNAQSSTAVAMSLPYRIFLLERLSGKKLFDWENKNFFAKENLQKLAKHFETDDKLENYLPPLFEWEHRRWISWQRANFWRLATIQDIKIFLKGGNIRQNLWIARLHACLVEWEALPKMAEELIKYGLKTKDGHPKDFQALDKAIILATKDLLSESILKQSNSLQCLFFAQNE